MLLNDLNRVSFAWFALRSWGMQKLTDAEHEFEKCVNHYKAKHHFLFFWISTNWQWFWLFELACFINFQDYFSWLLPTGVSTERRQTRCDFRQLRCSTQSDTVLANCLASQLLYLSFTRLNEIRKGSTIAKLCNARFLQANVTNATPWYEAMYAYKSSCFGWCFEVLYFVMLKGVLRVVPLVQKLRGEALHRSEWVCAGPWERGGCRIARHPTCSFIVVLAYFVGKQIETKNAPIGYNYIGHIVSRIRHVQLQSHLFRTLQY